MPARNCKQLYDDGFRTSGLYNIMPRSSQLCHPDAQHSGLLRHVAAGRRMDVIQRRVDGTVNFNRDWVDYKMGFGNLEGNFWLGLDNIVLLTNDVNMELYVGTVVLRLQRCRSVREVQSVQPSSRMAVKLPTKGVWVRGILPLSVILLQCHNGQSFSTPDKDNDASLLTNCAQVYSSGWWFNSCYNANLNGVYQK
eukprot:Em0018g739a